MTHPIQEPAWYCDNCSTPYTRSDDAEPTEQHKRNKAKKAAGNKR